MAAIVLVVAIIIALVISSAFICFAILYWRDPAKATKLLATIALFYRSTEKTRKHKRASDAPHEPEHPHRRSAPRKSLLMTITDVLREDIPDPKRRKSDQ